MADYATKQELIEYHDTVNELYKMAADDPDMEKLEPKVLKVLVYFQNFF